MKNEDTKMESEAVAETPSPVTDKEASKTTNVPSETETASSEKSTQNGALQPNKIPENSDNQTIQSVEETEPKITENGDQAKTEQADTEKQSEKPGEEKQSEKPGEEKPSGKPGEEKQSEKPEEEKLEQDNAPVEVTSNVIETTRVTRGAKRKANHETIGEEVNVTITEHNDDLHLTEEDLKSSSNVMGKGRRARVPNKRYSDILLTPGKRAAGTAKVPLVALEESLSIKEELLGDFAGFDSAVTAAAAKKSKAAPDLQVPLGLNDPDKEIVRPAASAGRRSTSSRSATRKSDSLAVGATLTTSGLRRRTTIGVINATQEKEKESTSPNSSRNKRKSLLKKGKTSTGKKDLSTVAEPMEVDIAPSKSSVVKTSKPCQQPCSISCDGLQGIIPMLQCQMCLCLYHYQCVGLNTDKIARYVCKNCQEQEKTPSAAIALPPPLTPVLKSPTPVINTTKIKRTTRPEFCAPLPPRPSMAKKVNWKEPSLGEMPTLKPQDSCNSLVGALTSYHPHNVQIVNSAAPTVMSRPQTIEYINGRRFMVIPKHNYMSVSSNTARSEVASSSAAGPTICLESNQEVPEGFSPSKTSKSPTVMEEEEEEKVKDDDVQAVPGDKDDVKNQNSGRQSIQATNQPKGQTRSLKSKSLASNTNCFEGENIFMGNYMQNISFGYSSLLYIFQYLKVQDLLSAGCVCTMWRDIASNPVLWRTVRMKNSQVYSFEGLTNTLKKYNTVNLDLRKTLLPNNGDEIWLEFSETIGGVQTLRKIEFCRCPAFVIEQLPISNSNLKVINAIMIKSDIMNFDAFSFLSSIVELKIKAISSMTVNSILSLKDLKTLKVLALTSVLHLSKLELSVLAELTNLESLDLGECTGFPGSFGQDVLIKLEKLEKLRLEKGQDDCNTFEILKTVKDMKKLEQLELINFDIKSGFDKAIGACVQLKKLMIIPTYVSQSATTNNMVLSGVLRLQGTLTHFVWGVTLELIRVTELFIDQCDQDKKNKNVPGSSDSIPVLKPVPDLSNGGIIEPARSPSQVEILPLPNLQKLLLNSLPSTRVKILKIPFHATWRQSLHDSAYL